MKNSMLAITLCASAVQAFPWVANVEGVDNTPWKSNTITARQAGSAATCPNNPNHQPAAPITSQYPYCGAKNGLPGKGACVNNRVPVPGDTAHQYMAPGPNDIRGPCPGINTAANHGFLARDGITTFTELVDMQQNVYGVGYDLAILLATLGVGLDGDPVTEKLSIGCDATGRTSATGTGHELGLDGHNKFEGDTSLTRNDYFLANGDNFSFNKTLYNMMSKSTGGNFGRAQLAKYRAERYNQSLAENGNFYYGPKSLLLYGAASFLYELFPSKGPAGPPSQAIEDSFFQQEKLPDNWYSRDTPYSIPLVASEIDYQYQQYPVAFGGNLGKPNSFVGLGLNGIITQGIMNATPSGIACLMYQLATENLPASIQGQLAGAEPFVPEANRKWAASKLNPLFGSGGLLGSLACPLNFNGA